MAGGTGGHVFPGLAVADAMRARAWNVVWLGNPGGMEATLVPRHGIPMRWVRFGGLRGKGLVTQLMLPFNLLRAFWQSLRVLREVRPAVVLGMGGYVAFPGGMMAALIGRPLVVHEQNSVAGLTNRVLARVADRVMVAFPDALAGAQWSGNPVRQDVAAIAPPAERYPSREGPLRVLVVGGSLGAQALNTVVPQALAALPIDLRPTVVHQSGRRHLADLQAAYAQAGVAAQALEFIDDMAAAYAHADLVICRAGARTVSEVAAAGVASLMVPYPHAVDDHQTTNARFLSEREAALRAFHERYDRDGKDRLDPWLRDAVVAHLVLVRDLR
jgi:UDP-N-acetylglucosamine--N-acetylmuramyl-(pentapeptide) pyrophosphoryl-undecaprenol N-acetylglucosamine transferase